MNLDKWPKKSPGAKVGYILPERPDWDVLTPDMRKVIEMRCGLGKYKRKYTLSEVCKIMGYNHYETVRQVEQKALQRLRHRHLEKKREALTCP